MRVHVPQNWRRQCPEQILILTIGTCYRAEFFDLQFDDCAFQGARIVTSSLVEDSCARVGKHAGPS